MSSVDQYEKDSDYISVHIDQCLNIYSNKTMVQDVALNADNSTINRCKFNERQLIGNGY